ncbi:tautomerase family protein [Thiothrix fructosivorans]|uniref:tautomerase family protein n=1 Tax=Thiothrix fructosivorans TaxID=111770 RepID=UPI001F5ED383|nr:tautomerase family protein [Thiothrix fructosivorans]
MQGRTPEQKNAFFAQVTAVAAETLGVKPEHRCVSSSTQYQRNTGVLAASVKP